MDETTTDPLKIAEQRGYARGYHAGKKGKSAKAKKDAALRRRNAEWNRAFIACMQTCIDTHGWKVGDKPIADIPSRTKLAADFADEAMKHLRLYP